MEGIDDAHAVDHLTVIQVLTEKDRTTEGLCRGHDERIPPGQGVGFLETSKR